MNWFIHAPLLSLKQRGFLFFQKVYKKRGAATPLPDETDAILRKE
ncbi:hypothetical protein [Bacillus sp. FJAT-29790]|nr:hypothetical protein [Bacillus sp. FJAT-29790]